MSKEKQIEEMARKICRFEFNLTHFKDCQECIEHIRSASPSHICDGLFAAQTLYNAGYRKQSEGVWIAKTDYAGYGYYCSNCNAVFTGENAEWIAKEHHYCPKCGANMKGGAE